MSFDYLGPHGPVIYGHEQLPNRQELDEALRSGVIDYTVDQGFGYPPRVTVRMYYETYARLAAIAKQRVPKPTEGSREQLVEKLSTLSDDHERLKVEAGATKTAYDALKKEQAEARLTRQRIETDLADAKSSLSRCQAELAAAKAELSKYSCPREGTSRFALLEVE